MHEKAFAPQCAAVTEHAQPHERRGQTLTLLALAMGSFCLGTSEFAPMGVMPLFSAELHLSIPEATNAITAYALGVLVGAPLVTLSAARLNRKTLLLALMALFVLGNLMSVIAKDLPMLMLGRFVAGLPHGGYFGASAVVASYIVGPGKSGKAFAMVMGGQTVATIIGSPLATLLGQGLGWHETFLAITGLGVLALLALWSWTPRTDALRGGPVMQELSALRRLEVWVLMVVAAIGVSSIFAVYTFVGPIVTDVIHADPSMIAICLAVFGVGLTVGNVLGGRLADTHPTLGLVLGFGATLVILAVLAIGGGELWILMACLFGVGAAMATAVPTIQVRLTQAAPEAPTLVGAMNLAALNVANAVGAWAGGVTIGLGLGLLSSAWAGFACTLIGLLIFVVTLRIAPRPAALLAAAKPGERA
ncbi:MFS transporter [Caulobacter soli]|uniref:MFS transporter n=1 Tax=Caulobacter soli TaxID=2708539 RepID=UPI0013EE16A6|nr:MFS transporter [Caulobacter soli]